MLKPFGKKSENLLEDFSNLENSLTGPGNKSIVVISEILYW